MSEYIQSKRRFVAAIIASVVIVILLFLGTYRMLSPPDTSLDNNAGFITVENIIEKDTNENVSVINIWAGISTDDTIIRVSYELNNSRDYWILTVHNLSDRLEVHEFWDVSNTSHWSRFIYFNTEGFIALFHLTDFNGMEWDLELINAIKIFYVEEEN